MAFESDQWHYQTIISNQWCPNPPSLVVFSFPMSHGTLIVIIYHRQKTGDVIEYASHPSIVFTSTFCSDQLHTFLWYISCLSSYRKLLVLINCWPQGCYVIEVSGKWMYQDWATVKSEYWWQIHHSSLRTKQIFLPTSSCQVRLVDFWSFCYLLPIVSLNTVCNNLLLTKGVWRDWIPLTPINSVHFYILFQSSAYISLVYFMPFILWKAVGNN